MDHNLLNPLILYGSSFLGALITGKVQKNLKGVPRDTIPANNTILWGAGAGAVGQDPISIVAGVGGSLTATLIHQLWKKVKGPGRAP